MDGRANQWGAEQPVDLEGKRKSYFSVSVSKKSKDGLFTITSKLVYKSDYIYAGSNQYFVTVCAFERKHFL